MNMRISCLATAVTLAGLATSANATVPEVTSATMSQDRERAVTVTYSLVGAPAVVTLDIQTNVTGDVWASIGGENIQRVTGDCYKRIDTDGSHAITWHPDLDWPDHKIGLEQGGVRAVVTAWALGNTPDYMVVDLSANAAQGSQRYYPSAAFLPGGLLSNAIYRTSSVVMRKIIAKDIVWSMGSIKEAGRIVEQEPCHEAMLTNNYYIGVFEVTQSQWAQVMPYYISVCSHQADGAMRPVDNVSYNMIRNSGSENDSHSGQGYWPKAPYSTSFLGQIRARTGIDFDLPSDAEWEFACRAGNGEGYWGNGAPYVDQYGPDANIPGRYLKNDPGEGTAIVGSYPPNDWGLYDMHGNVWEWCLDWFTGDTSSLRGAVNINVSNPAKLAYPDANGTARVRRSGSFSHAPQWIRSAARNNDSQPAQGSGKYGFRLACRAGLK